VAATEAVKRTLRAGQAIILESTTYPGTTREILLPALESTGLKVGEDFFLAFSPERVDPGNPVWQTHNTPKVVGGITPACVEVATALYASCIDTVVPVSSPEAAELVKLLENTFRSVNIGMVNEMAIVCDRLGVDVWEVIDAAGTKPFGFMKFTPGPGIGGHCIPLDPHYLAWKMRTLNYKTRFIDLASEMNANMPEYVVEKDASALNDARKAVHRSRILVLGVAYKRDIDDVRESPALDVILLLEARGAHVEYHDPFVAQFREEGGQVRKGVELSDALRMMVPEGMTMAQMALRWILDFDAVSAIIPGASSPRQARANVTASDIAPLGPELHRRLKEFYEQEVAAHIRGPY
jgi:UDP-N-acetyl-D-glucosamine dehydrogenase